MWEENKSGNDVYSYYDVNDNELAHGCYVSRNIRHIYDTILMVHSFCCSYYYITVIIKYVQFLVIHCTFKAVFFFFSLHVVKTFAHYCMTNVLKWSIRGGSIQSHSFMIIGFVLCFFFPNASWRWLLIPECVDLSSCYVTFDPKYSILSSSRPLPLPLVPCVSLAARSLWSACVPSSMSEYTHHLLHHPPLPHPRSMLPAPTHEFTGQLHVLPTYPLSRSLNLLYSVRPSH